MTTKTNRQTLVDYIAQNGEVFDFSGLDDNHVDQFRTRHIRSTKDGSCTLLPADESTVTVFDVESYDNELNPVWLLLARGFTCQCGKLKDITLQVPGTIEAVTLKSHGIDAYALLG